MNNDPSLFSGVTMNFVLFRRSNASSFDTTSVRSGVCVSVLSVVSFPCPGCLQNVNEGYNMRPEFIIEIVVPILCFAMLYFTFTVTCDLSEFTCKQRPNLNYALFQYAALGMIFDFLLLPEDLSNQAI